MANEVKIKLTDAQKAKIKEATGKELTEIRVESFGSAPVSAPKAMSSLKNMKHTKHLKHLKHTKHLKHLKHLKHTKHLKHLKHTRTVG